MIDALKRLLAVVVIAMSSATAALAEGQPTFPQPASYDDMTFGNYCSVALMAFTDAELMAEVMSDPARVAELSVTVNDPQTAYLMFNCAVDTGIWDTWMDNGTNLDSLASAAATMMEPATFIRWSQAPANPNVWQHAMAHLDPDKYVNWSAAIGNPAFYTPVTEMTEPGWWTPRIAWVINPQSYAPAFSIFADLMNAASQVSDK